MMDCGKQAAKLTILPLVSRSTIAEWEAETNITNSGSGFTQLKVWPVVGSPTVLANAGDLAVYWCCKWWYYDDVVLPAAPIAKTERDNRANGVYVASKTSNYTFFFPGLGAEFYIDSSA
jgi:hypothetical protein